MPGTTPIRGIPYSLGADLAATIDDTEHSLALALDTVAMDRQGALAARATRNPSPVAGDYDFATDDATGHPNGTLYRYDGTAWRQVQGYVPDGSVTSAKIADGTIALADLATAVLDNFLKLDTAADLTAKWLTNVASSNSSVGGTAAWVATFPHGLGRVPVFALANVSAPYTGQTASDLGVFTGRPTWDGTNVFVPLGPTIAGNFNGAAHANLLVIG